ncbi:MAG: hypothetical protein JSU82_10755 [Rhodospirillales bacterium]|nr:MAG: hypothetical protein JSU82_10755 [Rhodospirillales bacterium]
MILLANGFRGVDAVYGSGGDTAVWLFVGAGLVVALAGAFLLLMGVRERNQYRRATASISPHPEHRPASRTELVERVMATLAATDGEMNAAKSEALGQILALMVGRPVPPAAVATVIERSVSNDIASEVLASRTWLDDEDRDFILHSSYRLLEAMDEPGPVQEALLVQIAAAMGMSEFGLSEHLERFEDAADGATEADTGDGKS